MAADAAEGAQRYAHGDRSLEKDAHSQAADDPRGFDRHGFGSGAGGARRNTDGKPAGDLALDSDAGGTTFGGGRGQPLLGGPPNLAPINIVTLAVSPEAWKGREFDKLLVANRVEMVDVPSDEDPNKGDLDNDDLNNGSANNRSDENSAGRAGLAQHDPSNNGSGHDRGSPAEEVFVLDVTQEQYAELLKAVDGRSDAFAVIKEFEVDDAASSVVADMGAAATNAPSRSVAAAPSIAQGALRSTDVAPKVRGTPRETNPTRAARGSGNPSPGAVRPNALPPAAIEAPPADAPADPAPLDPAPLDPAPADPAPRAEVKPMPKPEAMSEEQSPPPAKSAETKPAAKPEAEPPAPQADLPRPESARPEAARPDSARPAPEKGESLTQESESTNAAEPAPRSAAGEENQSEKKAEGKSLRQDDPEMAAPPTADSMVPESFAPADDAPKSPGHAKSLRRGPRDDLAKEKFEAHDPSQGYARRIVPRSRAASPESRSVASPFPREAVEPASPVPPPAAPNKAIPEAVAEGAHGDKPATSESAEPNRKQVVDGSAEAPAVDRVAGPSPRVRVYFLLRPTYRVPARTELAAPADAEPSPVAPPAPAADAGPTDAAPAAPAPK
jgi:hypothetical protein